VKSVVPSGKVVMLVKTAAAAAFAGFLLADQVTAFGGAMPSMRLASSGPTSACLSMSASKVSSDVAAISAAPSEEGAAATRRHAIKSFGALAASVVFRDAAFAAGPAIADEDDDEADGSSSVLPLTQPSSPPAYMYRTATNSESFHDFPRISQPPPLMLAGFSIAVSHAHPDPESQANGVKN
jgi:hypothetical protein